MVFCIFVIYYESVLIKMKSLLSVFFLFATTFAFASQSYSATSDNDSRIDSLYSIVCDPDIAFYQKLKIVDDFDGLSFYAEYSPKLFPLFNDLLEQAKKISHNDGILFCYNSIADLYIGLWDKEHVQIYLDSAAMYIDKSSDVRYLAPYYRMKAQYVQRYYPDHSPETVNYYQKSLSYYEKSGIKGREVDLVIILHNLTIDGFQRNDSAYVGKNILRMAELKKQFNTPVVDFSLMDIQVNLYSLYFKNTSDEKYLDSAIYYAKECLELYENNLLPKSLNRVAVDLYVAIAELMNKKKNPDIGLIDSFLHIAGAKYNLTDTIGLARIFHTEAQVLYNMNMIDSAEIVALQAQEHLESGYKGYYYYLLIKNNIELLCDIYDDRGDYEKVIEYNDLWTKKDEEIRANEVKELELQYEFESKEAEIEALKSDKSYQENLYRLFALFCFLLALTILFVWLLLRLKKRDLNNHIALINTEKEDAKLKLKLKEEQTVKMQLEQYEVLSDFHLKEMELMGRSKDLDQLQKDKEALDRQVELFRQKVKAYEAMADKDKESDYDTQSVVVEDLKRLINKQPGLSSKDGYIRNLEQLSKSYIEILRGKSDENLSISYLKYCICFAIGMEISDVAEYFCIEQSSVHMIRYRLKKKFGLGNDDDLGLFLQKYVSS